jgi:hypothetical protein
VEHTLGAAFIVRREAIEQCGLFDEAFHMYCEEVDWQWRMARAGWERWIVPAATITHYGGQSTSQIPLTSLKNLWVSRRLLYRRYRSPLTTWLVAQLVRLRFRADSRVAAKEILSAWSSQRED